MASTSRSVTMILARRTPSAARRPDDELGLGEHRQQSNGRVRPPFENHRMTEERRGRRQLSARTIGARQPTMARLPKFG